MEPSEKGRDKCTVNVYPNVDYAFVVTLILIFEAMNPTEADNDDDEDDAHADTLQVVGDLSLSIAFVGGVVGMMLS